MEFKWKDNFENGVKEKIVNPYSQKIFEYDMDGSDNWNEFKEYIENYDITLMARASSAEEQIEIIYDLIDSSAEKFL